MTHQHQPRHMCLPHTAFHAMTDACLAAVVAHSRRHPDPFSSAAYNDYQLRVEQAILNRLIRAHLQGASMDAVISYDPDADPAPMPVPDEDDDLQRAA